jgi:hypothetical protein
MKINVRIYEWLLSFVFLTLSSCSFDNNSSVTQPNNTTLSGMTIKNPAGESQVVSSTSSPGTYTNVSLTPTFSWTGSADSYDIFIQPSNGITDPTARINQQPITTTNYSLSGSQALTLNTSYLWKIRAYNKSNGLYSDSKVFTFTTVNIVNTGQSGYVMTLEDTQVENPNYVIDVLFQVLQNNAGVKGLTASDFEVYEDGQLVSSSESVIKVTNINNIPFTLQSVILIDNSTSVNSNLTSVQNAANTLINTITGINISNATFKMKIEYFSDAVESVFDGTESGAGAGSRIKVEASTAINRGGLGIPPGAMSTDFYGAVIQGAGLLNSSYSLNGITQGIMFVLSDGNDTQESNDLISALNAVANKYVYTIGFGAEMKPDILSEIGSAGFYDASSSSGLLNLQNDFISLTNNLTNYANSFYKLSYTTPKRGTMNHSIIVKLKGVQDAAIQTTYMGW